MTYRPSDGRLVELSDEDLKWASCSVCCEKFARWHGPHPQVGVWLGRPGVCAVCLTCLRAALDLVERRGGLRRR